MRNPAVVVVAITLAAAGCASEPWLDPDLAVDVNALACAPPPPACTSPRDATLTRFDSRRQVETMLVGAWRFCGGDDNGWFGAGLELTPEYDFYVLGAAADGRCERKGRAGDWYTVDISEQNPDGTYQLVLDWHDGTTGIIPTFSSEPAPAALVDAWGDWRFAALRP